MIYNNGGYLTQADVGLSLDLYKDPTGFINSISVYGGVWNEFWSSPPPTGPYLAGNGLVRGLYRRLRAVLEVAGGQTGLRFLPERWPA